MNSSTAHQKRTEKRVTSTAVLLLGLTTSLPAAMLTPDTWTARNTQGVALSQVQDNNLQTGVLLGATQSTVRCVIDLGQVSTVHRLYFTAAEAELLPGSAVPELSGSRFFQVSLYGGSQPTITGPALLTRDERSVTGREIRVEANFRFAPVAVRYLILALEPASARL